MKAQFLKYWEQLHSSFWFVPAILALGSTALALSAVALDERATDVLRNWKWLYSGGAEGASAVLQTIAGSMITIAGVVFSMTLVALTLASAQFGPRLLRNFMRDTVNQLVELREQLSAGQGPTRYRQSVIATRVDQSSAIETTVSVWWVGVLSRDGAATPQAQWSTSSVSLILEDGDWKVTAQSTESGPTPDHSSDSEPISNSGFEQRLAGFVDWEAAR